MIAQLTGKRGQILGMNPADRAGFDVVEADVPQVELARYITELRTATQGLGTFVAHHERYDPVPGNRVETESDGLTTLPLVKRIFALAAAAAAIAGCRKVASERCGSGRHHGRSLERCE